MNDVKQIEFEVEKFKKNLVGFEGLIEALKSVNVKLTDFSSIGQRHVEEYEATTSNFNQIKNDLFVDLQNHRLILEQYVNQISLIKSLLTNEDFIKESINQAFSETQADSNEIEMTIVKEISELNLKIDREIGKINYNMKNLDLMPIQNNLETIIIITKNIENKSLDLINQLSSYFTKIQEIISKNDQSIKIISNKLDLLNSKFNGRLNLLLVLNALCMIMLFVIFLGKK